MDSTNIYILVSIIVLLILVGVNIHQYRTKKDKRRISPLATIAFGFVIMGFFFEENRFLGYGFFAVGIILSIMDISKKGRSSNKN